MMPLSSSRISIREARPADSLLLFELGRDTFAETFGPTNAPSDLAAYLAEAFSPEIQAAELADPASRFLIAEDGAEAVGYARLLQGAAPAVVPGRRPIELVRLYARAPWLGRGVGATLMRACLANAAELGCDAIWLGVWERNARAIAFYERWGFRKFGSHPFILGHDIQTDWLMGRLVTPAQSG